MCLESVQWQRSILLHYNDATDSMNRKKRKEKNICARVRLRACLFPKFQEKLRDEERRESKAVFIIHAMPSRAFPLLSCLPLLPFILSLSHSSVFTRLPQCIICLAAYLLPLFFLLAPSKPCTTQRRQPTNSPRMPLIQLPL